MTAQAEDETEDTEDKTGEKWEAFAPEHRDRRSSRIWHVLGHEWTLAALASVLLAVLFTWPTARHLSTTIPQDVWDPTLQAWQIAWSGHALLTDPANLWNANPFYPESTSLAFTDAIPGYAPFGFFGTGFAAAVIRYNLVFIFLHALAFFGGYVLLRQLGARIPGAVIAGLAWAYAPWRLAHGGHMNVISTGGILLALALLARGHGFSLREGYRAEKVKLGWVIAGWAVAAWQMTLGFAVGIPFGWVLFTVCVAALVSWFVKKRPSIPRKIVLGDVIGGVLFGAFTLWMTTPYLAVREAHPNATRTEADVALFSPPPSGLLTAPAENWLWGAAHEQARSQMVAMAEMPLLPGFALIGLAIGGLFFSCWKLSTRLWLAGGTALMAWFALGTQSAGGGEYGFLLLYRYLPGLEVMRTPGRLILWVTLGLAVLAAGLVSAFAEQAQAVARTRPLSRIGLPLRLAILIPVLAVGVEGLNNTPHPEVPRPPAALHGAQGPLMILPSDHFTDENAMLWSTDGFPKMVNGGSAFPPALQEQIRQATYSFPDASSVDQLRRLGVKTVIVLPERLPGTHWEGADKRPAEGVDLREGPDGALIFTL
ncbi:hypothetical protein [Longispora albida]|uniref:hypothetical protein n=1 Tax=Longispora albida TaxID=203523 RepID=UPI0003630463|nr:hypothetical protein [Longispora albida]